ncbi:hypothetical protein B0H13DRAFT_1915370 [Mycena leptocephala]|nr:hypothetical protein B0H13DRAFT_1915370 [Mycena leptocephala]
MAWAPTTPGGFYGEGFALAEAHIYHGLFTYLWTDHIYTRYRCHILPSGLSASYGTLAFIYPARPAPPLSISGHNLSSTPDGVPLFAFCVLCRIHGADLCSICNLIANYYDIQWDRFCREAVVVDHMFGMGQQVWLTASIKNESQCDNGLGNEATQLPEIRTKFGSEKMTAALWIAHFTLVYNVPEAFLNHTYIYLPPQIYSPINGTASTTPVIEISLLLMDSASHPSYLILESSTTFSDGADSDMMGREYILTAECVKSAQSVAGTWGDGDRPKLSELEFM